MPLTQEQFSSLRKKGLSIKQIASFEQGNVPQQTPEVGQQEQTAFQKVQDVGGSFSEGFAKGGLTTLQNIGKGTLGAVGAGVRAVLPGEELEQRIGFGKERIAQAGIPEHLLEPEGTAEKVGFATERVAEFFAPAAAVKGAKVAITASHAPTALKVLGRVATDIAAPTAVSVAQQGELNEEVGRTAALSGVISGAGEGVKAFAGSPIGAKLFSHLNEKLPARKINSILKPDNKSFNFGRNPGATVAKEKIKANTRGGLLTKIGQRKSEVGQQMDEVLGAAGGIDDTVGRHLQSAQQVVDSGIDLTPNGGIKALIAQTKQNMVLSAQQAGDDALVKSLNAIDDQALTSLDELSTAVNKASGAKSINVKNAILKPIKDAKKRALESGEKKFFNRLDDLENGLTKQFDESFEVIGDKALDTLTPKQAQQLKIQIGQNTRWTGQAFDNDLNQVRVGIYKNIDKQIDDAVPAMKALNERYGGLLTAEKALERTDRRTQRLVELGLRQTGVGGIIGASSAIQGDSPLESIIKGVGGAALFGALGSTGAKTRTAQLLQGMTPENLQAVAEIFRNIELGVSSIEDEEELQQ
jgi:hypothetical protein